MTYEHLIVFLPLIASIVSGFFGKRIGDRSSEILTSFFVSVSAILSLIIFYKVLAYNYNNNVLQCMEGAKHYRDNPTCKHLAHCCKQRNEKVNNIFFTFLVKP